MVEPVKARKNPKTKVDHGLCALDIARVIQSTGGRVNFERDHPGRPHVSILGCDDDLVAETLAGLSNVIYPPTITA